MNFKIITLSLIFISSCHYTIKKEIKIPVKQEEKKEILQVPVCGKDEILVCQKIKTAEGTIIKLEQKDYPSFKCEWDENLKRAFELNINYLQKIVDEKRNINYNFPGKKITGEILLKTSQALKEIYENCKNDYEINEKIRNNFDIYELKRGTQNVIFSSYYEPIFEARLQKDDTFKYPIYKKPEDMIEINLEDFDIDKYKGQKLTGRISNNSLIP